MYRIEGDGSQPHTVIWRDGEPIDYEHCFFLITENHCLAIVDEVEGKIDRMIITGIYMIISDGEFINTRIMLFDQMLRGVQSLQGEINKGKHSTITIDAILLPNIVEE